MTTWACWSPPCSVGFPEEGSWGWCFPEWAGRLFYILAGHGGAWTGDRGVQLGQALLFSLESLFEVTVRILANLGSGEPQDPVTFSPCGLDGGWEPPAWRPVSCQEDVLSSGQLPRPLPSL